MKKTLLFCGIFAIAVFNFMSCDDEDDNNNSNSSDNGGATTSNLSAEFVGASDCLNNAMDGIDNEDATRTSFLEAKSSISYKFDSANGELELILQDAELNCAATPKMDIRFSGDTIIFNPYNSTPEHLARCFCIFNLIALIGFYIVFVIALFITKAQLQASFGLNFGFAAMCFRSWVC